MSKMREECKHGSLRRSCEICDMEGLLKSSEEEMLFWRHAFRDVNAAQIAAEERVEELEAKIEELKAEEIDMLLHPEKYFSCYRDLKVVAAENAALMAEFDHAVRINNPCEHTGLESFVCDICGYPPPRIMGAQLLGLADRAGGGVNEL